MISANNEVGVLCRETAEQHVAGHQGNKQHHGALAKGTEDQQDSLADKVCNGAHQVSTLTGVAHSHSTGNESTDHGTSG